MQPNSETKPRGCYVQLAPGRKVWENWIWQTSSSLGCCSSSAHSLGLAKACASPGQVQLRRAGAKFLSSINTICKTYSSSRNPPVTGILHLDFSTPFLSLSPSLAPAPRCPRAKESSFAQISRVLLRAKCKPNRQDIRERQHLSRRLYLI